MGVFETMMQNRIKEGVLESSIDVPELRQLPSVLDVFPSVQPGQELKITRDLATCPGVLLQVHASLQQCFDDISVLRELEKTSLFQVASPSKQASMSESLELPLQRQLSAE